MVIKCSGRSITRNNACKMSLKLVENGLKNQQKSFSTVNMNNYKHLISKVGNYCIHQFLSTDIMINISVKNRLNIAYKYVFAIQLMFYV